MASGGRYHKVLTLLLSFIAREVVESPKSAILAKFQVNKIFSGFRSAVMSSEENHLNGGESRGEQNSVHEDT